MASVAKDGNGGRRRILFIDPTDSRRRTLRLGKCSARAAGTVCRHTEELVSAKIRGHAIGPATAAWLTEIGDGLHERLAKVGLVEPRNRAPAAALGKFTADYIESRRADAKPRTIKNLAQSRKELVRFFGEDKPMASITSGDAIEFRLAMLGRGLAENTVRRHLGRSRQFFSAAIDKELVAKNPFVHKQIKVAVRGNPARRQFIPRTVIDRVLAVCEDDVQWQVIICLARYAGLRTPSETLALKWCDVDWENNLIIVRCPKLERLERHATRTIPLFAELRPVLLKAFEESPTGSEFVIHKYRGGGTNLRSQFERLIRRSGQEPWGMPFQNLRSSREVELSETFPWFTVCSWLGHSREVAREHYMSVPVEHFARAVAGEPAPAGDGTAARKPAQQAHAEARKGPQSQRRENGESAFCEVVQGVATPCYDTESQPIPPRGVEPLSPG
ncbi:MAG: tyrosine-type recombinase/integrase [Planctomycetota bacterium]